MKFHDQDFVKQDIDLSGNTYTGCLFSECRIIFTGIGETQLLTNKFNNCQWIFQGPAGNTLMFLNKLYNDQGKELVEQLIEQIRRPEGT